MRDKQIEEGWNDAKLAFIYLELLSTKEIFGIVFRIQRDCIEERSEVVPAKTFVVFAQILPAEDL